MMQTRMVALHLLLLLLLAPQVNSSQEEKDPVVDGRSLSEWVKDLQSTDYRERQEAALAIAELGPQAKAAVPALIAALSDRILDRYIVTALQKIGPEAVPALI